MGHVLYPLGGGGADASVITATAGDVIKGKVILNTNGDPITGTLELTGNAGTGDVLSGKTFYNTNPKSKLTGTMQSMAGQTVTPTKLRQTISCSGKKMTSNIIIEAISDNYTQLLPGQVVFPEGVSPELIGVHPYYPYGFQHFPLQQEQLIPTEERVVFNYNYPTIWTTANYYGEHNEHILFTGSIDPSKYSGMWIEAIGRPTVEPYREDRFDAIFFDPTTKYIVGGEYGDYVKFGIPYNETKEISYLLNFKRAITQESRQLFMCLDLATDWSDDPNGGNHFFYIKKVQLVPK